MSYTRINNEQEADQTLSKGEEEDKKAQGVVDVYQLVKCSESDMSNDSFEDYQYELVSEKDDDQAFYEALKTFKLSD